MLGRYEFAVREGVGMLRDLPLYPVLAASDIERAKAWYPDKLDLTPEVEEPMGSLWYKTGDTWFLLYPTRRRAPRRTLSRTGPCPTSRPS